MTGRFAPSPTGALHVGNLRTALIAWLVARSGRQRFVLRMEDLDRMTSAAEHERSQEADLRALGIDWDGDVWRQSDRFDVYEAAIERLERAGRTYECFCSRKEIRDAAAAPHGSGGPAYPGTCRDLSGLERQRRRSRRPPAIRFRAEDEVVVVNDVIAGCHQRTATDVVLRRNDGVPAYNLAVVVDDHAQGVDQVVRGDDLLSATPSQVAVGRALGYDDPSYVHVPLVVGATGERLAKRDGAITVADLGAAGWRIDRLRSSIATSIGLAEPGEKIVVADLVARFDVARFARRSTTPITLEALLG